MIAVSLLYMLLRGQLGVQTMAHVEVAYVYIYVYTYILRTVSTVLTASSDLEMACLKSRLCKKSSVGLPVVKKD